MWQMQVRCVWITQKALWNGLSNSIPKLMCILDWTHWGTESYLPYRTGGTLRRVVPTCILLWIHMCSLHPELENSLKAVPFGPHMRPHSHAFNWGDKEQSFLTTSPVPSLPWIQEWSEAKRKQDRDIGIQIIFQRTSRCHKVNNFSSTSTGLMEEEGARMQPAEMSERPLSQRMNQPRSPVLEHNVSWMRDGTSCSCFSNVK